MGDRTLALIVQVLVYPDPLLAGFGKGVVGEILVHDHILPLLVHGQNEPGEPPGGQRPGPAALVDNFIGRTDRDTVFVALGGDDVDLPDSGIAARLRDESPAYGLYPADAYLGDIDGLVRKLHRDPVPPGISR